MRSFGPRLILICTLLVTSAAFAGEGARATAVPILPSQFAGWQMSGEAKISADAIAADNLNAALLKEYGFTDIATASYSRGDGRKIIVKAARFADASGAYGAFTYYKMPQMLAEQIGDAGASLNERVLFYRGNVLVDAVFSKLSAMSAAELRELAGLLPIPAGGNSKSPALPNYLPTQARVGNTVKYVVGPIGLEKVGAPLSAPLVDFNAGAEVTLGTYNTSGGEATLMLISYPTPQIAAEHLRRIDAAHQPNTQQAGGTTILDVGPIFDRRTGPMVVIASGPLSQSEARSLLTSVNYDADVTWNENTYFDKKNNLANLLVNVVILCALIIGLALVAGLAFGGVRVLMRRLFSDRLFGRRDEVEFISLHLDERIANPSDSNVSSSVKAV
jgi:hypothetical protein